MAVYTIDDLVSFARQRADLEASEFISASEARRVVAACISRLRSKLSGAGSLGQGASLGPIIERVIDVTSGTVNYQLPDDFGTALGVDVRLDSGSITDPSVADRGWFEARLLNFRQRNLASRSDSSIAGWAEPTGGSTPWLGPDQMPFGVGYMVLAGSGSDVVGNLRFLPRPQANHQARLTYVPTLPATPAGSERVDCNDGWEEAITWWAAQAMLAKEGEHDPVVDRESERWEARLVDAAEAGRDASQPKTVLGRANRRNPWRP